MAEQPELEPWVSELLEAFEIPDAPIDIDAVLSLAGAAAHQIVRPPPPSPPTSRDSPRALPPEAGRPRKPSACAPPTAWCVRC